jgi:hypothetical protein
LRVPGFGYLVNSKTNASWLVQNSGLIGSEPHNTWIIPISQQFILFKSDVI